MCILCRTGDVPLEPFPVHTITLPWLRNCITNCCRWAASIQHHGNIGVFVGACRTDLTPTPESTRRLVDTNVGCYIDRASSRVMTTKTGANPMSAEVCYSTQQRASASFCFTYDDMVGGWCHVLACCSLKSPRTSHDEILITTACAEYSRVSSDNQLYCVHATTTCCVTNRKRSMTASVIRILA